MARAQHTIVSAPRPTNANCPSDSWPAQPGERRDRQRDQRVDHDVGPQELLRPLRRGRAAARARKPNSSDEADLRQPAHVPERAQPLRDRLHLRRRATSRCRRGGCGPRTARARARRRTGRGRRSTGRASRRWRARCARTRRRRCRRRCVIGSDCMRAMSATTSARSSSDGPIATRAGRDDVAGRDAQQRCDQDAGDRRERGRDRPHDRRRPLDADAVDAGGVGVRRRRPHREPERRPGHEQREAR